MNHNVAADKPIADNKLIIALIFIIGILGAWLFKLGSELSVAKSMSTAPVIVLEQPPTVTKPE